VEDRIVKYKNVYGDVKGVVIINNLDDLLNFRKTLAKGEEVIISRWNSDKDDVFELDIYDGYRE
jgi:hypothetical protein